MSVFISIPKKGSDKECSYYYTHLTHQQSNGQNSPSQASTVCELRTSRCSSWFQKRQRNQRLNCQHLLDHRKKKKKNSRKTCTSALLTTLKLLTVWIITKYGILRDGNSRPPYLPPEKFVCRSRSNSQNWTWKNGLVPNQEGSMSRLYIVTLPI